MLLDDDPAVPEPLPAQLLHVGDLPRAEEQLRLTETVSLLVVDQLLKGDSGYKFLYIILHDWCHIHITDEEDLRSNCHEVASQLMEDLTK